MGTCANSKDPDEVAQNVSRYQSLQLLLGPSRSSKGEIHFY